MCTFPLELLPCICKGWWRRGWKHSQWGKPVPAGVKGWGNEAGPAVVVRLSLTKVFRQRALSGSLHPKSKLKSSSGTGGWRPFPGEVLWAPCPQPMAFPWVRERRAPCGDDWDVGKSSRIDCWWMPSKSRSLHRLCCFVLRTRHLEMVVLWGNWVPRGRTAFL